MAVAEASACLDFVKMLKVEARAASAVDVDSLMDTLCASRVAVRADRHDTSAKDTMVDAMSALMKDDDVYAALCGAGWKLCNSGARRDKASSGTMTLTHSGPVDSDALLEHWHPLVQRWHALKGIQVPRPSQRVTVGTVLHGYVMRALQRRQGCAYLLLIMPLLQ
jgi:hypothetical protein